MPGKRGESDRLMLGATIRVPRGGRRAGRGRARTTRARRRPPTARARRSARRPAPPPPASRPRRRARRRRPRQGRLGRERVDVDPGGAGRHGRRVGAGRERVDVDPGGADRRRGEVAEPLARLGEAPLLVGADAARGGDRDVREPRPPLGGARLRQAGEALGVRRRRRRRRVVAVVRAAGRRVREPRRRVLRVARLRPPPRRPRGRPQPVIVELRRLHEPDGPLAHARELDADRVPAADRPLERAAGTLPRRGRVALALHERQRTLGERLEVGPARRHRAVRLASARARG